MIIIAIMPMPAINDMMEAANCHHLIKLFVYESKNIIKILGTTIQNLMHNRDDNSFVATIESKNANEE